MGDIQDQLQNIALQDIEANQIMTALGKAFLNADATLADGNRVLESWSRVHAPTAGSLIPKSENEFAAALTTDTQVLLTPGTNEVYQVLGISYTNAGLAPATVRLELSGQSGTVHLDDGTVVNASATAAGLSNATTRSIFITKNAALQVSVPDGTATDITVNMIACKVVQ